MTRKIDWKDLGADDLKILQGNGINERDWQLWQQLNKQTTKTEPQYSLRMISLMLQMMYSLTFHHQELKALKDEIDGQISELNRRNSEDDLRIANKAQRIDDVKKQLSKRLQDYANRKDAKAQAEKQSLEDRIDLIDAQKEAAAIQSDINKYLQTEKQSNRIQDFLQQVEEGRHSDSASSSAG